MVHRGLLHVCDKQWLHVAEFSNASWPATLSGLWHITHKSNKFSGSEISLRCLPLDVDCCVRGAFADDFVAFAGPAVDDDVDAISEVLFEFGSVFLQSVDILSVVILFLSVIFLLEQEKQAK